MLLEKKKTKSEFDFPRFLVKNSKTQIVIVKNERELSTYFKKNLISNELIIGMGAGVISRWMQRLKYLI